MIFILIESGTDILLCIHEFTKIIEAPGHICTKVGSTDIEAQFNEQRCHFKNFSGVFERE